MKYKIPIILKVSLRHKLIILLHDSQCITFDNYITTHPLIIEQISNHKIEQIWKKLQNDLSPVACNCPL